MSFNSALIVAALLGGAEQAPGQLTLNIVDQSGHVLPAVEVAVTGTVTRQTKTDDQGTAIFRDLPAGSYRLSARLAAFVSESRPVAIRAGENTIIRIDFPLEWSIDPRSGKPIRDTIVLHCDNAAPPSIETFWQAADAVAWVRIDRQTVYDHWKLREDGFPIVTVHDARVLELFKPHARLSAGTAGMSILQEGGTIERADLIERASASGSQQFDTLRDYVVFLRWSDHWQQWAVEPCGPAALEMAPGGRSPAEHTRTGPASDRHPTDELLTILRKMEH